MSIQEKTAVKYQHSGLKLNNTMLLKKRINLILNFTSKNSTVE